jgi:hypothetical protein
MTAEAKMRFAVLPCNRILQVNLTDLCLSELCMGTDFRLVEIMVGIPENGFQKSYARRDK